MDAVEIAHRDLILQHLQKEMIQRKESLMKRQHILREIQQENSFLGMVAKDYQTYYDYIKNEKERQYQALEQLTRYIKKLESQTNQTETSIRENQYHQDLLLKQMTKIRQELNQYVEVEVKMEKKGESDLEEKAN
jgi:phosphopantothenate synthetase